MALSSVPAFAQEDEEIAPDQIMLDDRQVFVDWVPLPPGQGVCNGYYAEPKFSAEQQAESVITADQGGLLLNPGPSELTGHVELVEPDRRLFADKVTVIRNEAGEYESVTAVGGVILEEPGFRVYSDKASVIFNNNETTLWNAQYRYYARHARGKASRAETAKDSPVLLYDATFTTCAPDDNLWNIKANKVKLDSATGRGEAINSFLYLWDAPVLYVPYLNFPIDDRRQSGFLTPEYRTSNQNGLSIKVPYYFNLAPNYDATMTSNWMSDRGFMWGGEGRYMDPFHYTTLYGEYINHDRKFVAFRERHLASSEVPDPEDPRRKNLEDEGPNRWLVNGTWNGHYGAHWSTALEYNAVSDDEYLIDFGPNDFSEDERLLRQRAQVDYIDDDWTTQIFVQEYQTIQPFEASLVSPPYRIMPNLGAVYTPYIPDSPVRFTGVGQVTVFQHEYDPLLGETPTYGSRYHVEPTLAFPQRAMYGFLTPSTTLYETQYDLTLSKADMLIDDPTSPQSTIPAASVDMGLIFERNLTWFKTNYQQTLEPRLFYVYIPYFDQNDLPNFDTARYEFLTAQLFRQNRFSGIDRIGDANQVSLALTSRFYDELMGAERFKTTIGQIYYFENRRVMLCNTDLDPACYKAEDPIADTNSSPIVADLLYKFNPQWYLMADGRVNTHDSKNDLASLRLHYQPSLRTIMHVGFRYEESGNLVSDTELGDSLADLVQSDIGFSIAVTERVNVLGRWYYDIKNTFTMDSFGGLEYENCCWAVRTGARRYLQLNTGEISDGTFNTEFFLQWVFKGLGSVGRSPVEYFTTNIPGYQDRFEVNY
jgi:LPS-assembly protein